MIMRILKRILGFIFGVLILYGIFWYFMKDKDYSEGKEPIWGVTLSTFYASSLGISWQDVFLASLNELGVKKFRIPLYWQEVEAEEGKYDFSKAQYMLDELKKKDAKAILVVGRRQPRWPECHQPEWVSERSETEIRDALRKLLQEEVKTFKDHPALEAWQVENEPFLSIFGKCPEPDEVFLKEEMEFVQSQSSLPIILTDSGELSLWFRTASLTSIMGTTLYRVVWNPVLGFWRYDFVPPIFYYGRAKLVLLAYPKLDRVIISELQAEPWVPEKYTSIVEMPLEEQLKTWSPERFEESLNYAKRTGFDEAYLWGVEWWYWMKTEQDNHDYWKRASALWKNKDNTVGVAPARPLQMESVPDPVSKTGTFLDLPVSEKEMGLTRILDVAKGVSLKGMEYLLGLFRESAPTFLGKILTNEIDKNQ